MKEIVHPLLEKHLANVQHDFDKQKEKHGKAIVECIQLFMKKYGSADISYLHLSWLRTAYVMEKQTCYCIEGFSKDWFYDRDCKSDQISYEWLLPYLQHFEADVAAAVRRQMSIDPCFVRTITMNYAPYFQSYLMAAIQDVLQASEGAIQKPIAVYFGEYHGQSRLIYTNRVIEHFDVKACVLQPETYMCQAITNQIIENEEISHCSWPWMIYKECRFSNCSFKDTVLYGSRFTKCHFENCNFEMANIQDVSFEESTLLNCNLRCSYGPKAINLGGTISYRGVNFKQSRLIGCDFRFSLLAGADFTGAMITECRFDAQSIKKLSVTEEQRKAIIWCDTAFRK